MKIYMVMTRMTPTLMVNMVDMEVQEVQEVLEQDLETTVKSSDLTWIVILLKIRLYQKEMSSKN